MWIFFLYSCGARTISCENPATFLTKLMHPTGITTLFRTEMKFTLLSFTDPEAPCQDNTMNNDQNARREATASLRLENNQVTKELMNYLLHFPW